MNDGLKRIEPLLRPIYAVFCERNRQGGFHQADETRWLVFVLLDGKKGYGWWLWIILGADTVTARPGGVLHYRADEVEETAMSRGPLAKSPRQGQQ